MSPKGKAVRSGLEDSVRRIGRLGIPARARRTSAKRRFLSGSVVHTASSTSISSYFTSNTSTHEGSRQRMQKGVASKVRLKDSSFLTQTVVHFNHSQTTKDHFGDILLPKPNGTFRIAFQNVNKLPESKNAIRSRNAVQHIADGQYDIFLMAEVGLYHPKVAPDNQWDERTTGVLSDSKAWFAYNTLEPEVTEVIQYGGVGIIATDEAVHRIIKHAKDPAGLGRWVRVSLQGKEGHIVTFFSVYRPVENFQGANSVYQQHLRHIGETGDPREAILIDLKKEVDEALAAGHHIIIGMDANEHVVSGRVASFMKSLGLREAILEHHKDESPPETFRRNQAQVPIDGLFVSPSIVVDRAGYLAYDEGVPSDHRGLWIDVAFSIAFGQRSPPIQRNSPRRLKTKDPRMVRRYNKQLLALYNRLQLPKKLRNLKKEAKQNGWSPELERKYNQLHSQSVALRLQVEKKIRKLAMGGIPWSPRLQVFRDKIALWEMMVRRRKRMKVSMTRIRRYAKKTGMAQELDVSVEEACKRLDNAYKEYKKACASAENWRSDHQEALLDALAKEKQTSREKELQLMIRHERQRKQSRNVKRARGKLGIGRVTKVYYEKPGGGEVECTSKSDMDAAIITENSCRFSQSESTPPMRAPLIDDMGYYGEKPGVIELLEGRYPISEALPPFTQDFLKSLQQPEAVRQAGCTSTDISRKEHCEGWRKQREATSSEPSGPSFSHYIAAIEDPVLAEFDSIIRELPYKYGFSPEAWRRITDVSILKKAGVYVVEKMRTIQLMFAEFNMNNKKLGRDVMTFAERCKVIPADQYGSRKRHRCIMAALNKRLTMDILRQRHQAGAVCANDAKSCYDRIVHWVAVAALCRAGLAIAPALSMFLTLGLAIHYVSTAYGISASFYGKNRVIPFQGVGQGNGSGPAVWAVISSVLISMMYAAGHGAQFLSPLSNSLVAFVCYAFVDDTDLIQVGQSIDTPGEQVAVDMQKAVDRWEGGLRATGGALVPKKSHWYLIDFVWRNGFWEYRSDTDMPATLSVVNTDGSSRVDLTRHPPHHAEETLGVKLAMDGNNVDQVDHLLEKVTEFADHIRVCNLSKTDAWFALERCLLMTLEYCLPAVTLSAEEWKKVMAPIMSFVLPKVGLDRHFPRRLLFSPRCYQGAGLMHPWHRQCISHVVALVAESSKRSLTGKLMMHSIEETRLEVGLSGSFWSSDFKQVAHLLTPCWITNLWDFCSRHRVVIRDPCLMLGSFRAQDIHLMDEFCRHYTGERLRRLNLCRMFLKVTCLSEITTVDGQSITFSAWNGMLSSNLWNDYNWPRQPKKLPDSWWEDWRSALSRLFCKPNCRILRIQLGNIVTHPKRWRWFYSPSQDRMYHREGGLWRGFSKIVVSRRTRSQTKPRFSRQEECQVPPEDMVPISVYPSRENNVVRMEGYPDSSAVVMGHTPAPQLSGVLVHDWQVTSGSLENIADAIRRGQCLAVSDGSFKEGRCTSAFTLRCLETAAQVVGVNALPGPLELSDSFRGELGGFVGALEMIRWLCQVYHVGEGQLIFASDGEGAILRVSSGDPVAPQQACFDLLTKICEQLNTVPVSINWQWVKGHQSGANRSLASHLNQLCDETAKAYWKYVDRCNGWETSGSLEEGWQVWLGEDKLTSITTEALYNWTILFDPEYSPQQYWENKHQIPSDLFHQIDWEAVGQAVQTQPAERQRWIPKFFSGFVGTNQREFFRDSISDPSCPRCQHPIEDGRHVVKCKGPGTAEIWSAGLATLDHQLTTSQTLPELQSIILSRLRSWYFETPKVKLRPSTPLLRRALDRQDRIGWHNFVYGRAHYLWSVVQLRHYERSGSSKSPRRWLTAIINKLWNIAWDMWQHRNRVKHDSLKGIDSPHLLALRSRLKLLSQSDTSEWLPSECLILEVSDSQLRLWSESEMQARINSILAIKRRVKSRIATVLHQARPMQAFMKRWLASGKGNG